MRYRARTPYRNFSRLNPSSLSSVSALNSTGSRSWKMNGRITPSVLSRYHVDASASQGNATTRAMPCSTFDVLLSMLA